MIQRRNADGPTTGAPWTAYGTWDLGDFYRQLRSAVLSLEQAHDEGRLEQELADPELGDRIGAPLLRCYEALARCNRADRSSPSTERRRVAVHALLDQLRDEVFRIEHWGSFEIELEPSTDGMPLFRTTLGDAPTVPQRLDQLVARRFWGIGFLSDDAELTDVVSREAVRVGVDRLARDLHDVGKVLSNRKTADIPMVPGHQERGFEQLMVDILVENRPRARAARLREDFCQKTDLRVHYAGLDRKSGARVQVKATANPKLHAERIADIHRVDQLVILSPVRLAEFVDAAMRSCEQGRVDRELLRGFWASLPDQPIDLPGLSYSIREVLNRGLAQKVADPRGPLGSIPAPVRQLVREFVRAESFRATANLRAAEDSGASFHQRADGRMHYRAAPSARLSRQLEPSEDGEQQA